MTIAFQTAPEKYRHWQLVVEEGCAKLILNVSENEGLKTGYQLKLNSYDLSVDIELADAISRLRFEHPEVSVLTFLSGNDKVFCAGANIFMLGQSSHEFKVNFCKFTNETRLYLEDASKFSGIKSLCAASGTTAGGGYELALACDEIFLVDDGNSTVSLPEVPLLGVLPGTGGLTRLVDKRKVRKDLADVFSTTAEGIKGEKAVAWNLVDKLIPKSTFNKIISERANELAKTNPKLFMPGIKLNPLTCTQSANEFSYDYVNITIKPNERLAKITISGPRTTEPKTTKELLEKGDEIWMLKAFRELDDAILQLRFNYPEIGLIVFKAKGDQQLILQAEETLLVLNTGNNPFWLAREILLFAKRVLKRIDVTSRSLVSLIEPDSAFAGILAELIFASDRSYLLEDKNTFITLSKANQSLLTMGNGLSRLEARYYGSPQLLEAIIQEHSGKTLNAATCKKLGLVTFVLDEIDYEDEVRLFMEERASLSPDALSGMEANLRFVGPETIETKIFSRLSAWQNWIFIRDNATGPTGALSTYGKPTRAQFDYARC
ncbi:MAG: 2,3-epoxybenzoyl-CoA dihydrolase [bacterium]|nr:2,3-epoxybenzoyl-CoA dihydrolase [bacterium]